MPLFSAGICIFIPGLPCDWPGSCLALPLHLCTPKISCCWVIRETSFPEGLYVSISGDSGGPLGGSALRVLGWGWVQTSPCVPPIRMIDSTITLSPIVLPPLAGAARDHAYGFLLRLFFFHWCPDLRVLLPPSVSDG